MNENKSHSGKDDLKKTLKKTEDREDKRNINRGGKNTQEWTDTKHD